LWAIEGTGSFGAGLTTALLSCCERIVEVDRPQWPARRGGVKSDDIDAVRAARQALAGVGLSEPRRRGDREAIQVLLTTRGQAVQFRTRAIAALHALKPGSSVSLVVAAPLPRVPAVVGKAEASAIRSLKDAGFKVTTATQTRTTGQDGVVLSQSPLGGTRAKPKSIVRIVISNVQRSPDAGQSRNCTPGYSPCLPPASDYDCSRSANGPKYVDGPVRVTGSDPYGLDDDGDGVGCERS
jgi:hypothetical protein